MEVTVNKARGTLFACRRKLKFADFETKLIAYKSFIRPVLEYASTVWCPFTQNGINKLESIQKLAARFIFNDYRRETSSTELVIRAKLQPLQMRAKIDRLKLLFNILNGTLHVQSSNYIQPLSTGSSRLNHTRALKQYRFKNDCFRYSFFPRAIQEWNELPNDVVVNTTVANFVSALEFILN